MSSSSPRAPELEHETRLYFPVASRPDSYEAWPPGHSLAAFCLDADGQRERYLSCKRSIVQRVGRGPQRTSDAPAERAQQRAASFLRGLMQELPPWRGQAERLSQLQLDELMLQLQEDLAIMLCPLGHAPERARAVYLHVCFPSGWSPARLIGKSFPALHARVPYAPGFERAERSEHAARLFAQPAARYVWSLSALPELDRHPDSSSLVDWSAATEAFLRVERQIIVPLPADSLEGHSTALFFIRVYVYPLARLSRDQRSELAAALDALPESVRRYKGLLGHEARVRQLLL